MLATFGALARKGDKNVSKQPEGITFIEQKGAIDEYGRALYAVCRSILRALIDAISDEDLRDLNTPLKDVTLRQLAKIARMERDKGMRGDGFEWAVHEAIIGKEPTVTKLVSQALQRSSRYATKEALPNSLLFGQERAKYLGFLSAIVDDAGTGSYLLPQGRGKPFNFGPWVAVAAEGHTAESKLTERIKKIWKTDLFLSSEDDPRYFAATVKSNYAHLEGGQGLRIGIVPASIHTGNNAGVRWDEKHGLWVVALGDPNGFMRLFNDGYLALAKAIYTLGKHSPIAYFAAHPTVPAQSIQAKLERYGDALVLEVEDALNSAAQQDLVQNETKLVSVNAPDWLHIKQLAPRIICPKPIFAKLPNP